MEATEAVATHDTRIAKVAVRDPDDLQPGSLPWNIAQLERLTGELSATLDVLETRLRPILRDEDEAVQPQSPSPIPLSTHSGNVSSIAARTQSTLHHLRSVIDRVDV